MKRFSWRPGPRSTLGALMVAVVAAAPLGGPWAVVVVIAGALVVWIASKAALRIEDRSVLFVPLILFAVRVALIAAIDIALVSTGRSRTLAPDEALYFGLASQIAAYWHDATIPLDHSDTFIPSQYVQSIARVFFVTGPNLLVVKLLNTTLEVSASILVYRIAANLGLPRPRLGLLLMLVFPSLVAWSALGLKDTYVLFFEVLAFWAMSEFVRSRDHRWHLATALAFVPIVSVRLYVFVILVIAWLFIVMAVSGRTRALTAAIVGPAAAALLIVANPIGSLGGLATNLPYIPVVIREYAGFGRTSFVDPLPAVRGNPGDEMTVSVRGETPRPGTTPRFVLVAPGTEVFVEPNAPPPGFSRPYVIVRPGDVIVIASPGTRPTTLPAATPLPNATPRPTAVLSETARNVVGSQQQHEEESTSTDASMAANLRHIPIGLLYTVAAPFPWTARTLADLATIPEMLVWYLCASLAVIGFVVLARARDFRFAPGVAALIGLTFIFGLIQGNIGTLIRSRAMLIPLVIVLACVGADWAWYRLQSRLAARRRPNAPAPTG